MSASKPELLCVHTHNTIWTSKGNVTTLVELRQALSTGLKIKTE